MLRGLSVLDVTVVNVNSKTYCYILEFMVSLFIMTDTQIDCMDKCESRVDMDCIPPSPPPENESSSLRLR